MDASVEHLLNQVHRAETYVVDKEAERKPSLDISEIDMNHNTKENITETEENE